MTIHDHIDAAARAGVISQRHADAIRAAFVDHGDGAVELRGHMLSDDEREALDRLVVWMEHAGDCGR